MQKLFRFLMIIVALCFVAGMTVSCTDQTAEDESEDAMEETGEAAEDAGDATGDAIEDAGDDVEESTE